MKETYQHILPEQLPEGFALATIRQHAFELLGFPPSIIIGEQPVPTNLIPDQESEQETPRITVSEPITQS